MDSERIVQLLARQMGRVASDEEIDELLSKHPEYHFFFALVESVKSKKQHQVPAVEEEELIEESWPLLEHELDKEISTSVGEKKKKIFLRRWMWQAAVWVGAIVIAGSLFLWKGKQTGQPEKVTAAKLKEISLPYGAPEKKILPDSSIVWLNAGSNIHFAENFIRKNREVYLDGEAYFKIKEDAKHPFIVHAGNIIIRVLGTEFNVEAYAGEDLIETTLIRGKIQVKIDGRPERKIVLAPHEKLSVRNQIFHLSEGKIKGRKELSFKVQEITPMKKNDQIPEVAWLQDKLAFQNEPFDKLAKKLERRYHVHLMFKDTLLDNERLSGIFENENIQKAMKILQMTTPFDYQIKNDTVYLRRSDFARE